MGEEDVMAHGPFLMFLHDEQDRGVGEHGGAAGYNLLKRGSIGVGHRIKGAGASGPVEEGGCPCSKEIW